MNPEAIEIFSYLKKINPTIRILLNTNGGARNVDFWKALADLKIRVVFSIDGLEDTNHLYRRNVKWQNLMNNVNAFIKNGGNAIWELLIFKHNQHQIEEAKKLSKELGFVSFNYSFSERWQDFNSEGEYRNITQIQVDNYIIAKPENQSDNFIKIQNNIALSKNQYQNDKQNNFFLKKIRCWACNENKKEIYLRANGYVSPCCILGDVERNEPKNIINDYKKINLHYTDLQTILEGDFFKDISDGINGGKKRLQGCYHSCGVI